MQISKISPAADQKPQTSSNRICRIPPNQIIEHALHSPDNCENVRIPAIACLYHAFCYICAILIEIKPIFVKFALRRARYAL